MNDRFKFAIDLVAAHAIEHSAQVDIVSSALLGVEAQPEFEDRRDAPPYIDRAAAGVEHAGDDLEQGALTRPVCPDDAEHLTAFDLEAHIVEGTEHAVPLFPGQNFEGEIERLVIDMEVLGDVPDADCDVLHRTTLRRRLPNGCASE